MSGGGRQTVSFRDLVEEAKKRIVFLVVCVVGLSYLMSLTSSSVFVNLPAALFLIVIFQYLSLDYDVRRKAATYKGKPTSAGNSSKKKPVDGPRFLGQRPDWKQKVNSPVVENAIDQFTRHIVSEWVTDLWYSRITPDRQGPEELVLIMNCVFCELSSRMRNINLIDLLTRDIVNILSKRLELFRVCKTKVEKQQQQLLTVEQRDIQIKSILSSENKLHPILFSAESEHKVLQHVMDGLILITFRQEDLQCSLFRYITRELLACVVMRPVLNLASPKFINERIESLVINARNKGSKVANEASPSRIRESPRIPSDPIPRFPDPSVKGVELVQLKKDQNGKSAEVPGSDNIIEHLSKDPLLSIDTRSTRSWSSLPETHDGEGKGMQRHHSGGEWGDVLDEFSRRKTEVLAPEHFDNMWTKGRDYKGKEDKHQLADPLKGSSLIGVSSSVEQLKIPSGMKRKDCVAGVSTSEKYVDNSGSYKGPGADNTASQSYISKENCASLSNEQEDVLDDMPSDEVDSWSSSYTDNEDTSTITGLDSPGVKVWDGKNKRNFSRIHHPLETFDRQKGNKTNKDQLRSKRLHRTKSAKKKSRSSSHNGHVWQEVERTSFLLGESQDLLSSGKVSARTGDSSEDSESELLGRMYSGATTSSSISLISSAETHSLADNSAKNSIINDSFFTLRSEVSGANIVKSGSKTFAVYCISVTDVNNKSWSIKRRFQHFEELHRRLKEFPEYNLHLPPKHFLSTGLDLFVIQERCKLLDEYLKKLLQLPTISSSIEVWDFLSVDSQMYVFSNSLSIVETISVALEDTVREKRKENRDNFVPPYGPLISKTENLSNGKLDSAQITGDCVSDGSRLKGKGQSLSLPRDPEKDFRKATEGSSGKVENVEKMNTPPSSNLEKLVNRDQQASHPREINVVALGASLPSEWVPPNVSLPILDLVDVILQLKDGGWIRRKAFWVAKQILQLGMGDAFDDWLIEKIQLLRQGSVVASGIKRLEQILWPDGIFITKHPSRQRPSPATPSHSPHSHPAPTANSSPKSDDVQMLEEEQRKEAERRAKFVYELMIDKAPAAIVGLVGHKEYEQCAKDLYYFIQSSVCLKLVAFDLLELLLLTAFPELDHVFQQLEDEKEKFGKLKLN